MIKKYLETKKAFEIEEQKIQIRINKIISNIFHHLKLDHYHQNEWLMGYVDDSFIHFGGRNGDYPSFNRFETDNIDYNHKIPTRFLSMTDNEILLEVCGNIHETEMKKSQKENTRKVVLNKLTGEEKKILGVY